MASNPLSAFGSAFAALGNQGLGSGGSVASAMPQNSGASNSAFNFGDVFANLNFSGFSGGSIASAAGGDIGNNKAPPEGQYLGGASTMDVTGRMGGSVANTMADSYAAFGGVPNAGRSGRIGDDNNAFAGGITYTTPPLNFGTTGSPAPNSGFSFDIPLSTVNNMTNGALDFASANTARSQQFFGGVFGAAQTGVEAQGQASTNFLSSAFQRQADVSQQQGQNLQQMFDGFLGASKYNADAAVRVAKANNSGCFITTAICDADSKADDCDELQTLRAFRDDYMVKGGKNALVQEYYSKAPAIVLAIKNRQDAAWCFEHLKTRYLQPAIAAVKAGDNEKALMLYTTLFVVAKSMAV